MMHLLLFAGILQASSAVDVGGRAPKYVRTEKDHKLERASVTSLGEVEAHASLLEATSLLEEGVYVYQEPTHAAEICADEDNGWPVQCISTGEDSQLEECAFAASYCAQMSRITQTQYALYTNCLRDVCSCKLVGMTAVSGTIRPDTCNVIGSQHQLGLMHLQQSMDRELDGGAGTPLAYVMAAVSSNAYSWDPSLPSSLTGTEKTCAFFGYGHLFSFDRLVDPNIVTEYAMQSNYNWITNGMYWLVRDPASTVSIQAHLCYAFDFNSTTYRPSLCSTDANKPHASGAIRSLSISGRFLKGHHLRIDAKYGDIQFDGYSLNGQGIGGTAFRVGATYNSWSWKWPANCQQTSSNGTGCLIFIQENPGITNTKLVSPSFSDLIMEVALPLGITLTLHRYDFKINALVRMRPLGTQEGLCGNFDNDIVNEFGTAGKPGGDNFIVSAKDNGWSLPKVQVSQCCADVSCLQANGANPVNTPFACLPLDGMYAWYQSSSMGETSWNSKVGGFSTETVSGTRAWKADDGPYMMGDTTTKFSFGKILPSAFTICTVSRYNSPNQALQRDLFVGDNQGNSTNSLFWAGRNGDFHTGAAYFGGWVCELDDYGDAQGESSGPHAAYVGVDKTQWYAACGTNTAPYVMVVHKDDAGRWKLSNTWQQDVVPTGRGGNQSLYLTQGGLWAVAEVITYNRALSPFELNITLSYLKNVISELPACNSREVVKGQADVCAE